MSTSRSNLCIAGKRLFVQQPAVSNRSKEASLFDHLVCRVRCVRRRRLFSVGASILYFAHDCSLIVVKVLVGHCVRVGAFLRLTKSSPPLNNRASFSASTLWRSSTK